MAAFEGLATILAKSIVAENRTLRKANNNVFINHGLKQPLVVSSEARAEFGFEFVLAKNHGNGRGIAGSSGEKQNLAESGF